MVQRREYLEQLILWKHEKVIKVITGIRRCGKSTLLQQYQDWLRGRGIEKEQILSINFEDLEYEPLLDYRALYKFLKERLCNGKMTYVFLDEIQKVDSFQKVVDSLYIQENVDICITGSNSYILSGDLATLLTGRYVEISILPLSYREYCEAVGQPSTDTLFADYLKYGGFPYLASMRHMEEGLPLENGHSMEEGLSLGKKHSMEKRHSMEKQHSMEKRHSMEEKAGIYLEGIYNTVIINDIEERQRRKESDPAKRKINDIALLKSIAKYLSSVIGSPVSVKSVTDYLTSNGRRVSQNTISDYMEALTESYVFYAVERFDLVGKQLLKANRKFYIADLGIRNHILPRAGYDLGFSIENVVYFELRRRGYRVTIGKLGNTEVDFVAEKGGSLAYFQVTASLTDRETFEREIRPLRGIRDNYPKTILTLDRFTLGNYDGILAENLVDWLMA